MVEFFSRTGTEEVEPRSHAYPGPHSAVERGSSGIRGSHDDRRRKGVGLDRTWDKLLDVPVGSASEAVRAKALKPDIKFIRLGDRYDAKLFPFGNRDGKQLAQLGYG